MLTFENFCNSAVEWISSNSSKIVSSVVAIILTFVIYRLLSRQITRWKEHQKLEENIAFTLKRILQWVAILAIVLIVTSMFVIDIGIIGGLLTLAGGTIIGFASMNTLGNAIAGIIVMTSRPFKIGDRIFFNGQFADVIAIDLIYTRMKTLDNVLVSIPNQELLKSEIDNYGKKSIVRRGCSITAGYELSSELVESTLQEAANKLIKEEVILKEPKPYVWITNFGDYAVEYTLYVYVNKIKLLPKIDAVLKRNVLEISKQHGIDISTPTLIQRVGNIESEIET
ncbi:MAG: mechanosensitive ion channel [Candidatus Bathyarchaeota archaeon]|nr:mechanosensitive ion channel [Candidatus Bathyarchaeota archaeon]